MHKTDQLSLTGGTLGGTLLSIWGFIPVTDLLKAAVLAAVGALVSFGVSYGCKLLVKRFRR